jgi:hypothetical protein
MVIKIDISYVSDDLKSTIQNAIQQSSVSEGQSNDNDCDRCRDHIIIVLSDDNNRREIKRILEDVLRRNQINDYIVVDNTKEENEIAILKKGDMEQLGIFICSHCGMVLGSEGERTIHQRIHYFI